MPGNDPAMKTSPEVPSGTVALKVTGTSGGSGVAARALGLHPDDSARLLDALQRLVDAGNSVVVIEHNRDFLRAINQLLV
jgi:hypothetical protein